GARLCGAGPRASDARASTADILLARARRSRRDGIGFASARRRRRSIACIRTRIGDEAVEERVTWRSGIAGLADAARNHAGPCRGRAPRARETARAARGRTTRRSRSGRRRADAALLVRTNVAERALALRGY